MASVVAMRQRQDILVDTLLWLFLCGLAVEDTQARDVADCIEVGLPKDALGRGLGKLLGHSGSVVVWMLMHRIKQRRILDVKPEALPLLLLLALIP